MTSVELKTLMDKHFLSVDEVEESLEFVRDLLECYADKLKREEPYATNSINRLEAAALEVSSILSDVYDLL